MDPWPPCGRSSCQWSRCKKMHHPEWEILVLSGESWTEPWQTSLHYYLLTIDIVRQDASGSQCLTPHHDALDLELWTKTNPSYLKFLSARAFYQRNKQKETQDNKQIHRHGQLRYQLLRGWSTLFSLCLTRSHRGWGWCGLIHSLNVLTEFPVKRS